MSHFSDKNHLGGGPHPERRKREGRSERARLALRPSATLPRENFLPVDRADMDARGWDRVDVLLVSGDAYVDHPSELRCSAAGWKLTASGSALCRSPAGIRRMI